MLPEAARFLWRQAATVTPLLGSDLQIGERESESTDSDKERGGREVEGAEGEEERVEQSPKEVQEECFICVTMGRSVPR